MTAPKFAAAGLIAGLTLIIASLISSGGDTDSSDPLASPRPSSISQLDRVQGLKPIDEVVLFWQERAEGQPLDYINRTHLGVALSAKGREQGDLEAFEEAALVLQDALGANASYPPARLALASALHSQHRFSEAAALADELIAEDPQNLAALAVRGDAAFESGDYERAAEIYAQLHQAEPSAPTASRLAQLAFIRGDTKRSVALAAEALAASESLALRPNGEAFYHFQLGHFLFKAGDTAGAVAALERALEIDPGNGGATELLAFVSAATGDTDRAVELYSELVDNGPAPDIHGSFADILRELGDTSAADQQEQLGLELARETAGRFPSERRHLAEFFLTRDPAQALALAEDDLLERRDVGSLNVHAWALFQTGSYEQASDVIAEALDPGSRDARLLYHAAAIAHAVGDEEAARQHLADGLEINPNFHPGESKDAQSLAADLGIDQVGLAQRESS